MEDIEQKEGSAADLFGDAKAASSTVILKM
jgi:hypothetical protein